MKKNTKLYLGSALSAVGGVLIIFVVFKGAPEWGNPWTFLAGLLNGIVAGIGVVLVISGLTDKKKEGEK
jgi:hypothetical protein